MEKIDVNITQLHKQEFVNLQASQLILQFSGKSVNSTLVNTFRRLCLDYVPTYAFCNETITIERNTSIFNNDYMKLRLNQLTMPKIMNDIMYLEDKYWYDVDYSNPTREKHPADNKILEFYVTHKNNTKENLNVDTTSMKIFENSVEIERFDKKFPSLIVQLRPGEEFSCRAVAVLGVGKRNNIWSAIATAYYDRQEETNFKFTIESQGQYDEYEILYKACEIIKNKLMYVKKDIINKHDTDEVKSGTKLLLRIQNEDHTIGNIINEYLQSNKNIVYAGLSKPDLLVNEIVIKFESVNKNPLMPLFETLDYLDILFTTVQNQILKLGNKYFLIDVKKTKQHESESNESESSEEVQIKKEKKVANKGKKSK